jgi:hypothetical protein
MYSANTRRQDWTRSRVRETRIASSCHHEPTCVNNYGQLRCEIPEAANASVIINSVAFRSVIFSRGLGSFPLSLSLFFFLYCVFALNDKRDYSALDSRHLARYCYFIYRYLREWHFSHGIAFTDTRLFVNLWISQSRCNRWLLESNEHASNEDTETDI